MIITFISPFTAGQIESFREGTESHRQVRKRFLFEIHLNATECFHVLPITPPPPPPHQKGR